jgi:hypothetical protein
MNQKKLIGVFIISIVFLFILFFIGLMIDPMGPQRNIFYDGLNDFFADFFNLLPQIALRNPYADNNLSEFGFGSGFPLGRLVLYPFARLENYYSMTLSQIWGSKIALMSAFLFSLIQIFLFYFALSQMMKKYNLNPWILFGLFFSYVFFFSIERGNTIVINAALVCYFLCNYDSGNKKERLLAGVSLALAATLKIYPVLLGFLYFEKKQYREIVFSASCTLFLIFFPFLLIKGGLGNIHLILNNITQHNNFWEPQRIIPRFSLPHLSFYFIAKITDNEHLQNVIVNVSEIAVYLVSLFSVILSLWIKDRWIKISLLVLVVLFLPKSSVLYCGLYMFPVIILFFATLGDRSIMLNIITLMFYIILLNPFQITFNYKGIIFLLNYVLGNIVLLIHWLVLLAASIKCIIKKGVMRRIENPG